MTISGNTPVRPRVTIIAELGANATSLCIARKMVRAAAACGADAVKVQAYTADQMTIRSGQPEYLITKGLWAGTSLYDLYERAATPLDWLLDLRALAGELGLQFIVSVFHPDMIEPMEALRPDAYKVASFEINYKDLWMELAFYGRPVIVSTGTAAENELDAIVDYYQNKEALTLLKCTSQYPAPLAAMNLATIPALHARYHVPVGLSDHTTGIICPVMAVALGATMIEKHFKIDEKGFDAAFSLDPRQFMAMTMAVREAEQALGQVNFEPTTTQYKRKQVDGRMIRTV